MNAISICYSSTEPFSRCSGCGEGFKVGDVVLIKGEGRFHSRCYNVVRSHYQWGS